MDDPRDILRAAGAECPEVEAFVEHYVLDEWVNFNYLSFPAILALARLVADAEKRDEKHLWQRDELLDFIRDHLFDYPSEGWRAGFIADLDRRWATDHQAPPAGSQ